jgi:hypothetical protein
LPQLFPTLQELVLGLQNITVNTPINSPPNNKFSQPSEIYPELALKYAQTNDGMIPITNEINNSSNNNLDLSDEEGNFGDAELL